MRIREMVLMQKQSQSTNPNFVPITKNTYGVEGMEITGTTIADRKIIPVSDDIKEKLISLAKNVFINNYGMNDGEEMSALMREYTASVPKENRVNASWTLHQIWYEESKWMEDMVSATIPNWKPGDSFDKNFVKDLISRGRIDQKI